MAKLPMKYVVVPIANSLLIGTLYLPCASQAATSNTSKQPIGIVIYTKGSNEAYQSQSVSHKVNYRQLIRRSPIYAKDFVKTNLKSKVKILFKNGKSTTIGENKILNVGAFLQQTQEPTDNTVTDFLKNSFRHITGIVSHHEHKKQIEHMPVDSIGIR